MSTFFKRSAGYLFIGIGLLMSCTSNSQEILPNGYVRLAPKQSARIGMDVLIQVDSIQDGRCPSGAYCIWAGQAWVNMHLSAGGDASPVRLALGPDIKEGYAKRLDSTNVMLNSKSYKVILHEVNPSPSVSTPVLPQTAIIEVTRL